MNREPKVIQMKMLGMQLCIPTDWNDGQIIAFAERENPAGTTGGWHICEDGDESLCGCPARVPCAEREEFTHVVVVV